MRVLYGHDYYDGAGYGVDSSVVFVREQQIHTETPFKPDGILGIPTEVRVIRKPCSIYEFITPILVLFCGDIFPAVVMSEEYNVMKFQNASEKFWSEKDYHGKRKVFYDYDELVKSLPKNYLSQKVFRNGEHRSRKSFVKQHFGRVTSNDEKTWMIENRIVVGMTDVFQSPDKLVSVISNFDKLKNVQFFKVLDPHSTYQSIFSFVSGALTNNPKIEDISDESKILKAGFDLKSSFRKCQTI